MFREVTQRKVGLLTSISVVLVTLFVTPQSSLDPINVPKMWMLLALAFAVLGVLILDIKPLFTRKNRAPLLAASLVVLFMLIAMLVSNAPISQQLFGTYGRNTGLVTYFAFAILFIGGAFATGRSIQKSFLICFGIAVGANAIYGILQALDKDPINWANPYTPVIGTLGNPNFVSSLLGMGAALPLAYLFASATLLKYRVLCLIYFPISIFAILESDSQQGLIILLLSTSLVGYFLIKSRFNSKVINKVYLITGLIVIVFGIAGTLKKGPLARILYKDSVTYRGDYWHAGLKMFKENLYFGVGLDSYGDWYRASRTVEATLRRGSSVVSNAAHNVYIDIAATSGIFAIIAYCFMIFFGFKSAYQMSKSATYFDPFFVGVLVTWVGYLVQSSISINNLALGIWGWVLPGILISMKRWSNEPTKNKSLFYAQSRGKAKSTIDFSGMGLIFGLIIGGTIGFLPFNSDANFRNALVSGDVKNIDIAAKKWPTDVARLNYAAQIFDQNKMPERAMELSRESLKLNPRNFEAWSYLYNSTSVSRNEKREILHQLRVLDPHNPDLKKLG